MRRSDLDTCLSVRDDIPTTWLMDPEMDPHIDIALRYGHRQHNGGVRARSAEGSSGDKVDNGNAGGFLNLRICTRELKTVRDVICAEVMAALSVVVDARNMSKSLRPTSEYTTRTHVPNSNTTRRCVVP